MEDYVDYDEEIPDDSDHDKLEEENQIAPAGDPLSLSNPASPGNTFGSGMQLASNLAGFQKPAQQKDSNKFLNQFHTKKQDESEEESYRSEEEAEGEGEGDGTALIETLIKLYNLDPESLGEFERDLVEKELAKRKGEESPLKEPSSERKNPLQNKAISKENLREASKDSERKSVRTSSIDKPKPVAEPKFEKPMPVTAPVATQPIVPKKEPLVKSTSKKSIDSKSEKSKASRPKTAKPVKSKQKATKEKEKRIDASFKVIVSKDNSIKDVKSVPGKKKKKRSGSKFVQPPMVFDLSEPSEHSDDYIFKKPERRKSLKKSPKRRKSQKPNTKGDVKGAKENLNRTRQDTRGAKENKVR